VKSEEEIRLAIDFNRAARDMPGTTEQDLACEIFANALEWVLNERAYQSMDVGIAIVIKKDRLAREAANQ